MKTARKAKEAARESAKRTKRTQREAEKPPRSRGKGRGATGFDSNSGRI